MSLGFCGDGVGSLSLPLVEAFAVDELLDVVKGVCVSDDGIRGKASVPNTYLSNGCDDGGGACRIKDVRATVH